MPGMRDNPTAEKRECRAVNHAVMVALHFMQFTYCRIHQTLRVTPAMQAGLADHVWEIEELVALID
jgi:hypothetical protein